MKQRMQDTHIIRDSTTVECRERDGKKHGKREREREREISVFLPGCGLA